MTNKNKYRALNKIIYSQLEEIMEGKKDFFRFSNAVIIFEQIYKVQDYYPYCIKDNDN
jgi:hypothetical protein